jgi:hypothetical protein
MEGIAMKQHEITESIPLLNEDGNLTQAGYARSLLPVYCRRAVKGGAGRLKEWDYYLVMGEGFALALTIADNSYMGLHSISFLDFKQGWQETKSPMRPLTRGNTGLPETSETGHVAVSGKGYGLLFRNENGVRTLVAHMDKFHRGKPLDAHVTLTDPPEESMVIATPFSKPGHFYYNQKINCMRAVGTISIGEDCYTLNPETCFGTLDWGRGVWTYQNTWYWGSVSGVVNGKRFGFNLGYGFGDTSAATENALFYGGKLHKLEEITFHIPFDGTKEVAYTSPWTITSSDRRFHAIFSPIMDRAANTSVGIIASDQHQVFGTFDGWCVLDDGTKLEFHQLMGFAEKVTNRW